MHKKLLLSVLLVFLLSIGFASAQDVDPSGVTISYWHQYSDGSEQGDTMAGFVEEFNANNEYGITVEATFQGSYGPIEQLMESAILSGELPNLVAGYANAAANWNLEGVVVDVNSFLNDETWGFDDDTEMNLNYNILDVNQNADGMRLAWANQNSVNMFYINTSMAQRLGFDGVPATLAELEAMACAAAEQEGIEGYAFAGGSSELESWIAAHGGHIFNAETGQYDFTTPEVLAAFEYVQNLFNNGCGYFGTERFQNTADFANGLNLATINSSAGIPFVVNDMITAENTDEWVVTSVPGVSEDSPRSVQLFVPSQVMIASTPEQELATWIFMKFVAEKTQQEQWAGNTGYLPIRLDAELSADTFNNDAMPFDFFQQVSDTVNGDNVAVYASPALASYSAVRGLLGDAFAEITSGGADINEVAAELNEEANELLAELDM